MTMMIGRTIEAAIQEQHQVGVGDDKHWEFKYKLSEILDSKFRFPSTIKVKEPLTKPPEARPDTTVVTTPVEEGLAAYIDTKVFKNTRGAIIVDSV